MSKKIDFLRGIGGETLVYDDIFSGYIENINSLYRNIDFKNVSGADNIILDCYSSATIEGANTTVDEVRRAMTDDTEKNKSTLMVTNCLKVVGSIADKDLDEEVLIAHWNTLVEGVCENERVRGTRYRNGMVYVGEHIPESAGRLEDDMRSLFGFIDSSENAFIKAAAVHFYFVYIHPFCDGNGRMARILFSKILYDNGLKDIFKVPVSNLIMNYKERYYRSIKDSEISFENKINITPFLEYMFQILERSFQSVLTGEFDLNESRIYNLISKHSGAELTVKKCADILKMSETTARNTLNKMVVRGTLIRFKTGNKYFYRINYLKK